MNSYIMLLFNGREQSNFLPYIHLCTSGWKGKVSLTPHSALCALSQCRSECCWWLPPILEQLQQQKRLSYDTSTVHQHSMHSHMCHRGAHCISAVQKTTLCTGVVKKHKDVEQCCSFLNIFSSRPKRNLRSPWDPNLQNYIRNFHNTYSYT